MQDKIKGELKVWRPGLDESHTGTYLVHIMKTMLIMKTVLMKFGIEDLEDRCLAHILILIVQAALCHFGRKLKLIEENPLEMDDDEMEEDVEELLLCKPSSEDSDNARSTSDGNDEGKCDDPNTPSSDGTLFCKICERLEEEDEEALATVAEELRESLADTNKDDNAAPASPVVVKVPLNVKPRTVLRDVPYTMELDVPPNPNARDLWNGRRRRLCESCFGKKDFLVTHHFVAIL
ncbi:hypothetical protein RQP46_003567 [Phenoliferia psychrophenolica]